MILLLTRQKNEAAQPPGVACLEVEDLEAVLAVLEQTAYEKVILDGLDLGINPFELARRLRQTEAPALVLAGRLRADQRFWAERNGCHVAEDLNAAFSLEI